MIPQHKPTGGFAFPVSGTPGLDPCGMNLRDYFAAKAMQIMWDAYDKGYCGLNNQDAPNVEVIARGAYAMADAMLEQRK